MAENSPDRVIDVGNCALDHGAVKRLLADNFKCEVVQCHGLEDTLAELHKAPAALVLVNRKLDADHSDGVEIIKSIKADPSLADTPVMLLTNYDDYQRQAVQRGAERGFGKLEYDNPETREKLAKFLKSRS